MGRAGEWARGVPRVASTSGETRWRVRNRLAEQNAELRALLNQYLSSKINDELQVPPRRSSSEGERASVSSAFLYYARESFRLAAIKAEVG